jgi:hypothetical protein
MKRKREIPGNHKIGYGRPPQSGKYKKGHSGNLEGGRLHKRHLTSPAEEIDQLERELVTIVYKGRRKSIPRLEASLRRLMNQAANGSLPAGREFLRLSKKYYSAETPAIEQTMFMAERPAKSRKWVRVR